MGDCEHGKLAVTTSEIFLKKQIKKYTKAKISWQEKRNHAQLKKNSQIPTQYRNVTFNFQGTDFVLKQCVSPF